MLEILCCSLWPFLFSFCLVGAAHVPVCSSFVSSCHWVHLLRTLPIGSWRWQWQYGPCASKAPLNTKVSYIKAVLAIKVRLLSSLTYPCTLRKLQDGASLSWHWVWGNSKRSPGNPDRAHHSPGLDPQRCTLSRCCTEFVPPFINTKLRKEGASGIPKATHITCSLFSKGIVAVGTAQTQTSSSLNRLGAWTRDDVQSREQ